MVAPKSFVPVTAECHFTLQNLPYGIFSADTTPQQRVGVAIGDMILDLAAVAHAGLLPEGLTNCFAQDSLNAFMSLGPSSWKEARQAIMSLLSDDCSTLRDDLELQHRLLIPQDKAQMHMPVRVGDYTDFYLSKEHATNCTRIFRGDSTPLQANWTSLPVGYHGRASSVVVSEAPVFRPKGQVQNSDGSVECVPSRVLDFELEMAAVVGCGNARGSSIDVDLAGEHVFGLVLLNDWSARDIQKWEYVPLGPFNGKNFASSISPWVVPLAALELFKCPAPEQQPAVLPYLREQQRSTYDIHLEASIRPSGASEATTIAVTNFKHLYWTIPQMVAHHTVGGCNLQPGDLLGTGTISREGPQGAGCLLEATWNGKTKVQLNNGSSRLFLEDGDSVILTGYCEKDGFKVGFGTCTGQVLPAVAEQAAV